MFSGSVGNQGIQQTQQLMVQPVEKKVCCVRTTMRRRRQDLGVVSKPTDNTKKFYFWNMMDYIALMILFTIKIKLSFEKGKYNCRGHMETHTWRT